MGYVIDASVAVKWFVAEDGAEEAAALLEGHRLAAPDLLVVECANILWKKARRSELSAELAMLAGRALERLEIELVPMRQLIARSLELALELDHPAYDCVYLALAVMHGLSFVTADEKLVRKIGHSRARRLGFSVLSLPEAAAMRPS
jgi:predicted nucleic acid-binding protein